MRLIEIKKCAQLGYAGSHGTPKGAMVPSSSLLRRQRQVFGGGVSLEEAICGGKQRGQAGMHLEPHSLGELSRGQEALDFR